jgi:uncharacterized membrane protein YphA (DoxX/SURF4 family)
VVTKWILDWFSAGVAWLGGLIDLPGAPDWVEDLPGYIDVLNPYTANTGAWIPWTVAAAVLVAYGACLAAGLVAKLVRIGASFATLGGGSAA